MDYEQVQLKNNNNSPLMPITTISEVKMDSGDSLNNYLLNNVKFQEIGEGTAEKLSREILYKDGTYEELNTNDNTILGAINELNETEVIVSNIDGTGIVDKPTAFRFGKIVIVNFRIPMPIGNYSGPIWEINPPAKDTIRGVVRHSQTLTDVYVTTTGNICINGLNVTTNGYYLLGQVVYITN